MAFEWLGSMPSNHVMPHGDMSYTHTPSSRPLPRGSSPPRCCLCALLKCPTLRLLRTRTRSSFLLMTLPLPTPPPAPLCPSPPWPPPHEGLALRLLCSRRSSFLVVALLVPAQPQLPEGAGQGVIEGLAGQDVKQSFGGRSILSILNRMPDVLPGRPSREWGGCGLQF